jgi:hypothetical protein
MFSAYGRRLSLAPVSVHIAEGGKSRGDTAEFSLEPSTFFLKLTYKRLDHRILHRFILAPLRLSERFNYEFWLPDTSVGLRWQDSFGKGSKNQALDEKSEE